MEPSFLFLLIVKSVTSSYSDQCYSPFPVPFDPEMQMHTIKRVSYESVMYNLNHTLRCTACGNDFKLNGNIPHIPMYIFGTWSIFLNDKV